MRGNGVWIIDNGPASGACTSFRVEEAEINVTSQ